MAFEFEDESYPLVVQAGNDVIHWINIYRPTEAAMVAAFETVYGRELDLLAITFALGYELARAHRTQRLEIYPDGRVVQNTFSAPTGRSIRC